MWATSHTQELIRIIVPICGYCSRFAKDDDFPSLFGKCDRKIDNNYVAFRSAACMHWTIAIGLDMLENFNKGLTEQSLKK